MKTTIIVVVGFLFSGCYCRPERCWEWTSPIDREDLRACNAARAGDVWSDSRFHECMSSMGYYKKQVECKK